MKRNIKITVCQNDWLPGFGGYRVGSVRGKQAVIELNMAAFLAAVESRQIPRKDLPYEVAKVLMHEMIHVFEDWAGAEFNHRRIAPVLKRYRNHSKGGKS